MRPAIVAALAAVCSLVLTACGAAEPAPAPATPGAGDRFPVTINHAYGTTTIPAKPQRIVALGYDDIAIAGRTYLFGQLRPTVEKVASPQG